MASFAGAAKKIGFIGAGKMAQALARGMIASGLVASENLMASSPAKVTGVQKQEITKLGVKTINDNVEIAHKNEIVFLAVKPNLVRKVAAEIAPSVNKSKLIISIAMGINIESIESLLPAKARVVRVIPNTPAILRAGASAYAMGHACHEGDSELVKELLSCVGYAVELQENQIDAVTGLASCGPSYMFCAIEAMADAGVKLGIERKMALNLAAHAMLGAAKMVLETDIHPALLKDDVQVPGGASSFGVHILERTAFRGILMDAVIEGAKRSEATGAAQSGGKF